MRLGVCISSASTHVSISVSAAGLGESKERP